MYPYLKEDRKSLPDREVRNTVYKNTSAMSMHKLGSIVVNGTDNLILSSMVSLASVAVYSNYFLIISSITGFFGLIFKATTASVGNLGASKHHERLENIFNTLTFIEFWFYGFSSVCLYVLLNHFIYLWIGESFVFSNSIVFVLVLNYYLRGMREVINIFRDALGLFWHDRYKPVFEALVNLVFSIVLAKFYGIIGVFIGTAISTLTVCFWVEPYVLYRHVLKGKLSRYFLIYFKYVVFTIAAGWLLTVICGRISQTATGLLIKIVILCLGYNSLFLLFFFQNAEFKNTYEIGYGFLRSRLRKNDI